MLKQKFAIAAAVMLAALTACGSSGSASSAPDSQNGSTNSSISSQTERAPKSGQQDDSALRGQVTAIDGSSITLTVGGMGGPGGGRGSGGGPGKDGQVPEFGDASSLPEDIPTPSSPPEGTPPSDGTFGSAPESAPGGGMGRDGNREDQGSQEEKTIVVSDDTAVTSDGAEASLSDIQVGSMISVTMDGDTVVGIEIMTASGFSDGNQGPGPGQPKEGASEASGSSSGTEQA